MSRPPSYPQDAAVGDEAAATGKDRAESGGSGAPDEARRTKRLVAGAAIGIGSAAIVAALLYAKKRKADR
jgi:hypothetical protein